MARALVAGEFKPGDRITADADLVSGTLVFSTEGATVVGRRRADGMPGLARREDAGRRRGRQFRATSPSAFDLPDLDEPRRSDDDGGELLN